MRFALISVIAAEEDSEGIRKETFSDTGAENLYHARELLAEWVRYQYEEGLHSAMKYLRPVHYYVGNPEALLAE